MHALARTLHRAVTAAGRRQLNDRGCVARLLNVRRAADGRAVLPNCQPLAAAATRSSFATATTTGWRESDFKLAPDVEQRVLSPALVVSLPNVRHNIAAMIELCGGDVDRWRPHVKTTKMPLVWRELIGSGVRNFKCATIREARLLCEVAMQAGVAAECDILVAFPLQGANLHALGLLASELGDGSPKLSCLVEGAEDIDLVPDNIGYFLDINPGMDRTGRSLPLLRTQLPQLAAVIAKTNANATTPTPTPTPTTQFRGLHYYDGHSSGWASGAPRRAKLFPGYADLVTFVKELEAEVTRVGGDGDDHEGFSVAEVITSGTPSCTSALAFESFFCAQQQQQQRRPTTQFKHRVSPGTTVFHDYKTHEENDDLAAVLRPAAAVLTRVVSHPKPGSFSSFVAWLVG